MRMIHAFLRNDDVRGTVDESLAYLSEQAVAAEIPISMAVEPANTTPEVAAWLRRIHAENPSCLEIIQHGYDHRIKTTHPCRGEFGKGRSYAQQRDDIIRGSEAMDRLFGDQWSRIFSFPYGAFDDNTLRALEDSGFRAISTGIRFTAKRTFLNTLGRAFRRSSIMGRHVVHFNGKIPGFSLREAPVTLNNTLRQTGPDSGIQKSARELRRDWERLPRRLKTRGILCHHRFNSREDIDQLILFMKRLKTDGVHFARIEEIA